MEYFLEIKDNDNVTGPNTGQSEIFNFNIFDSRKEQENLVRLQEELSEKMIALLGNGLVEGEVLKTNITDQFYGKKLLASHVDDRSQARFWRSRKINYFKEQYCISNADIHSNITHVLGHCAKTRP